MIKHTNYKFMRIYQLMIKLKFKAIAMFQLLDFEYTKKRNNNDDIII